ncbi:hypothetical protein N7470_004448 [Penicillium chermesinum]|nr:hypothetical protein N7470_004448 [Penicillium chermesinum]
MNPSRRSISPGRSHRAPVPNHRHPNPPSDDDSDDEFARPGSSGSDASSNVTTVSAAPITPVTGQPFSAGYFSPNSRLPPAIWPGPSSEMSRHRSRHHSQGFFEPSLPTASSEQVPSVSASRIAAQTAMQQIKRADETLRSGSASPPPPPPPLVPPPLRLNQPSPNAATTAANVPESKKKKKLFSKPKHIGISREKDGAGRDRALPSPSKLSGGLSRMVSASTTSLADLPSNNSSMYSLSNASVNTVVPAAERPPAVSSEREAKEKEKHKPHFLSRQKLKLKDRDEHFNLPLSSASSNSRPADPNAPKSLYSFTSPASPAPGATFGKSVTGLDLLHGGRALREKKKEEKALAESEHMEWLSSSATAGSAGAVAPSSLNSSSGVLGEAVLRETLQGFGLNNMSPEDAWDFLKAKLLVIFDGEDVRIAIEDLNKLVLVHLQHCVQKRTPTSMITDLQELLATGFATLNHSSLVGIPDDKVVPHLVQVWMLVFGTILPFIQAVFLPLDLEFKGCGSLMTTMEAREFWSSLSRASLDVRNLVLISFRDHMILNRYDALKNLFSRLSLDSINTAFPTLSVTSKSTGNSGRPGTAASLDAGLGSYNSQSSTLLSTVADSYSSESTSGLANRPTSSQSRSRAESNTSSNPDQMMFSSLSSPPVASQRPTVIHRPGLADSSHVITETVGRMLQCVSVLASVQTEDASQEKIELLSKALKHNWFGRGRTGRDRRGFVGAKVRPAMVGIPVPPIVDDGDSLTTAGISVGASTSTSGRRGRGGSSSSEWSGQGLSMRSGRQQLSVL